MKQKVTIIFSLLIFISSQIIQAQNQISYSTVDWQGIPLDEKIIRLFNCAEGVFVEVGAHDEVTQSNTKRLEQYYGWKGILIEPSELLFGKLLTNRPLAKCFQCALGSFEENDTYAYGDFDENTMSSINGTRLSRPANKKVSIRCLQSILDEINVTHINFFSLDTEGYELNILKGIDFSKTTFDFLLIEIYQSQYQDIVSFLMENGYQMVESFSNYNKTTNPGWDGMHNDYLFARKK